MSGMRRLGELYELKYGLVVAASNAQVVADVKRDIVNAYNLYVNPQTAKEPLFQMLANAGEPFSENLVSTLKSIVDGINKHSNTQLFVRLNNLLGMMRDTKKEDIRQFIHDSVRVTKESERNYREHLKSKFEMLMLRLSSILKKKLIELQQVLPKGMESELEGDTLEPQRKELSKEQLLMFMRTPSAQAYHLDDMDVMYQILSDPELKSKLTTLVNAISRGHLPVDGPEIAAEAKFFRKWLDRQKQTNVPALEKEEPAPSPLVSAFEEESKAWDHRMASKYNDLTLERHLQ